MIKVYRILFLVSCLAMLFSLYIGTGILHFLYFISVFSILRGISYT